MSQAKINGIDLYYETHGPGPALCSPMVVAAVISAGGSRFPSSARAISA